MVIGGIIWLVLCFVIAAGAGNRGRSAVGFFFLSALLSPLIGFIALIALGNKKPGT